MNGNNAMFIHVIHGIISIREASATDTVARTPPPNDIFSKTGLYLKHSM